MAWHLFSTKPLAKTMQAFCANSQPFCSVLHMLTQYGLVKPYDVMDCGRHSLSYGMSYIKNQTIHYLNQCRRIVSWDRGINSIEMRIKLLAFSIKNFYLKMLSADYLPYCSKFHVFSEPWRGGAWCCQSYWSSLQARMDPLGATDHHCRPGWIRWGLLIIIAGQDGSAGGYWSSLQARMDPLGATDHHCRPGWIRWGLLIITAGQDGSAGGYWSSLQAKMDPLGATDHHCRPGWIRWGLLIITAGQDGSPGGYWSSLQARMDPLGATDHHCRPGWIRWGLLIITAGQDGSAGARAGGYIQGPGRDKQLYY